MLVGAWGGRAGELLERGAERTQTRVERIGALTMPTAPDLIAGPWSCWLLGEPQDRGGLATRFGSDPDGDLPAAFARSLTELGEEACELLCGRFILVALYREGRRCLIVRDQLGAQPLVYAHVADGILFAEHERDLLGLLERSPYPDRLGLLQWIEDGTTPRERTLYEGIWRLPAGHRLVIEEAPTRVERWWSPRYEGIEDGRAAELAERLRDAAFAAVRQAAAGSKRPAVKLSGGLDSACVAAGLAASGFADGHGLAIGESFADHPEAEEGELIEATARHTGLPLELVPFDPTSSMLAPALAHIARWRLPPTTQNLFLWQPLMARARELGVDVLLDGEGGDELFGLAPRLIADTLRGGRPLTAWSLSGRIPGMGLHAGLRLRVWALRRYGVSPLVPAAIRRRREQRAVASSGSLVRPADARALVDLHMARQSDRHDEPLWWRFLVESLIDTRDLFGLGAHFRREAADARIERRHPFLYDLHLTEAVLRLPPRAQFDPVYNRPLLRCALSNLIPEAVRTRRLKSHFTALMHAGIRADEAGLIEPLKQTDAPVRAYVDSATLDRTITVAPDDRPVLEAGVVWRVAIANRWLAHLAEEES